MPVIFNKEHYPAYWSKNKKSSSILSFPNIHYVIFNGPVLTPNPTSIISHDTSNSFPITFTLSSLSSAFYTVVSIVF